MKIKDLPQEIKELVLIRYSEQGIVFDENIEVDAFVVNGGFAWQKTHEGVVFWKEISKGNFSVYYEKYGYPNDKPKDSGVDYSKLQSELETIKTPEHYCNDKGTLYKVALDRGWNPYLFEIVKRIERCEKKGEFLSDIDKSITVLRLYLQEQGHRFKDQTEPLNK